MDLTFIYALLSQGFGLPDSKILNVFIHINKKIISLFFKINFFFKFKIYNQVNKMEISWALGAAFHLLDNN